MSVTAAALIAAGAVCDACRQPSDALVTFSDGRTLCLPCREVELEQLYREQYGPDYDRLATYSAEGR